VNNYKVSIYIPAFNAEKTIEQSLNSIINQTYKFNEIIVINDKSNDSTSKILTKFKNIRIIENKNNMGLGYNRNLGVKMSTNDIVASIDADVVLDKKWLETIIKYFEINSLIMCSGKMTEKYLDSKINEWRSEYYSQNWGNNDIENPPFLYGCNTIQHKDIWKNINGYNEELFTNGEDIDYSDRIKQVKKFKLIYCSQARCEHLQNDDINSLADRIWRYHSFGYKLKKPSILKTLKLSLKQFKFFINRSIKDICKFRFKFIKF